MVNVKGFQSFCYEKNDKKSSKKVYNRCIYWINQLVLIVIILAESAALCRIHVFQTSYWHLVNKNKAYIYPTVADSLIVSISCSFEYKFNLG